jgi:hypothetical protein
MMRASFPISLELLTEEVESDKQVDPDAAEPDAKKAKIVL